MGLVIDYFAGGGGASEGIEKAIRRPVDYAINHDPEAIAMHMANHPGTHHLRESVWDVDPYKLCRGRDVDLGWFSPDCTFHSKARGGKPFRERNRARRRRGLAWVVHRWIDAVRPRVIMLENVEEFADWGPLLKSGQPDPKRRGETFRRWHRQFERQGYKIDMREMRACDYGAPTTRRRLFVIARCDDEEIVFPEATHGSFEGAQPYRTAAECIDWSLPCPSIFTRDRPLAEATLRRIARGIQRYVVDSAQPFVVPGHTPFLASLAHGDSGGRREYPLTDPLGTTHTSNKYALVAPTLINTRNGERIGQSPRVRDIRAPFPTVTAAGSQGALVTAFLAKHYGGHEATGKALQFPIDSITSRDHHALVTSHIIKLKGTCKDGRPVTEPLGTIQAGGQHYGEVRAFLIKYYGTDQNPKLTGPLGTITTKDRFGLVTVRIAGEDYAIVDIGMRMLSPRELYRAQGFDDTYKIELEHNGKPLTKEAQIRMCGNSVSPYMSRALVEANVVNEEERMAA